MTMTDKIRRLLAKGKKPKEVAEQLKIAANRVYTVKWLDAKKDKVMPEQSPDPAVREAEARYIKKVKAAMDATEKKQDWGVALTFSEHPVTDNVNHPPHYKTGGIETIDFIEAKDLNYRLGNVVKYVSRAGKKSSNPIEDLQKAAWYLNREIEARKNA